MGIDALTEGIDALAASDPFSYSDKESVLALVRLSSRLDCIISKALASFDAGGEWALDGAQTPVAWLDTRGHLEKNEARRRLRLGRALAHMPLVAQAWSNGDIKTAQVEALARARTVRTEELFERDEELLVDQAEKLKFAAFSSALGYWENLADPDGAKEADLLRQERRDVSLVRASGGNWVGHMNLDQISGTIVSNELGHIEHELFEADWAQAKEALGREPKAHELARTPAQRRADALVEMATRSGIAPADGRRPRPLFSVLVGWETLRGRISELAGGQVLSPDAYLSWLDGADFERAVFAPGQRVEVSVTARLFSGATKRAIELRDRHCTHPYCDIAAEACQIDHIVPYSQGGETTQENGRLLCGFHNRLRNGREPPDEPPG
jgi:hypothetical protein